jgi:ABC-2 type transport system permease protein
MRQILAIAWAQFRTMRNHLPRTSLGAVLLWCVSLLWYGLYVGLALFLGATMGELSIQQLRLWVPVGLLGVLLFWQIVPLFTLSSGWSLELGKLQMYPVSNKALFFIEVILRFTTAPEMIIVLAGAFIGLVRHPAIPVLFPLFLLLFIPFNLFLSLAIREFILHAFEHNRFRELFAILMISIAVVPQLLARTALGRILTPYFLALARGTATPWHEVATLSLGKLSILSVVIVFAWTALCYSLARWQFEKGLRQEEGFRATASLTTIRAEDANVPSSARFIDFPSRIFSDPMAALLQKEFQSLLRMPRFRVIFGMACVFSVVVFVPMVLNAAANGRDGFLRENFLPVTTLYGLLLLSDALLLNVFGFDRHATQLYFVAPVPFEAVLKAKNLTALVFIAAQAAAVLLLGVILRLAISPLNVANAVAAAAVVGLFFLTVGNLTSISMARPIDPTQTFRKQSSGRMQLWFALCSLGMFVLVGFAFLARWALQTNWALLGVLIVEFGIGLITYRIATESAVERALREREKLLDALSKGPSPIGLGLS